MALQNTNNQANFEQKYFLLLHVPAMVTDI